MFGGLLPIVTDLYRRWMRTDAGTRRELQSLCDESLATGLAQLGVRRRGATQEYVWLLFDSSKLTDAERQRHIADLTPAGYQAVILRM
jgi:hypothetical protein